MGIRKYASVAFLDAEIESGAPVALRRTAHRVDFHYTAKPGMLYVRSRMISSRCNDNFDEFPAEEIKGDGRTTGYVTFVGKPVFVNHHNTDHRRARGVIVDAKLHEDTNPDGTPDTWVEGLMEVDAVRFPKLAEAVAKGWIDRTSMGVDVERSTCSKCANVATSPLEYCHHIPAMKGSKIRTITASGTPTHHLVRERCAGLRFFENSLLVEDPADPTAFVLGKVEHGPAMEVENDQRAASRTHRTATKEWSSDHFSDGGGNSTGKTCSRWNCDNPATGTHELGGKTLNVCSTHRSEMTKDSSLARVAFGVRRCASCYSSETVTFGTLTDCGNCGHISDSQLRSTAAGPRKPHSEMTHEEKLKSFSTKDYPNPGDHPGWEHLGADPMNLVDHYDSATQSQHHDGMRWYPDAHILSHHLGNSTGRGIDRSAAMLAVMSPQMEWGINMHHALRALHTGIAPGEGEGMNLTEATHRKKGQAVLDGPGTEDFHHAVLNKPKTQTFHHLIRHAGMDPATGEKSRKVCVDVHAMSALCGRQLKGDDKVLGQKLLSGHHFYAHAERCYQDAADHINARDGSNISPSELQAITWGVRRQRNKSENPNDKNIKALQTVEKNNRETWQQGYKEMGHDSWTGETAGPGSVKNLHATRGRRPFDPEQPPPSKLIQSEGGSGSARARAHHGDGGAGRRVSDQSAVEGRSVRAPGGSRAEARGARGGVGGSARPGASRDGRAPSLPPTAVREARAPGAEGARRAQAGAHRGGRALQLPEDGLHPRGASAQRGEPARLGREAVLPSLYAQAEGPRGLTRRAYGEVKAPADIDTLRDEECPICGESTSYDGNTCAVCGFVQPPPEFQDPDLDLAKKLDLRKDDADPTGMDVGDVAGVEDSINDADRDGLDDETGQPMDQVGVDGEPQDDLVCPVCGEGFNSQPVSISTENPMAGSEGPDDPEQAALEGAGEGVETDGNAAEGEVCPNCGEGVLETPGRAEAEEGLDPEMAEKEGAPGSGRPTDEGEPTAESDAGPEERDEAREKTGNPFGDDDEGGEDDEPLPDDDVDEDDDGVPDEEEDSDGDGLPDDDEDADGIPGDDDPEDKPGRTPWRR